MDKITSMRLDERRANHVSSFTYPAMKALLNEVRMSLRCQPAVQKTKNKIS